MIFITRNGPPTHVIDATSGVKKYDATIVAEDLSYILVSSAGLEDKNTHLRSPKKKWTEISVHRGTSS